MSPAETVLIGAGALGLALLLPGWRWQARLMGGGVVLAAAIVLAAWMRPARAFAVRRGEPAGPARALRNLYVGSEACRSCHPSEHASFVKTFHRTMTQRPRATNGAQRSNVMAPLPSDRFRVDGETFALVTDGDRVLVERASGARSPIVLSTGSHHYQAYWTEGARPGEQTLLPFVYLGSEKRFVPRRSVFLTPDDAPPNVLPWSGSCIQCHAVAGRPRRSENGARFDTDVVELGIACEACHGPGGAHVDEYRDPLARAAAHGAHDRGSRAKHIVNPAKLDATDSTGVCAQCHSLSFPRDENAFWQDGTSTARPQAPFVTRELLTYETLAQNSAAHVEAPRESLFWPDGTIRVGGREANAHFLSPCFVRGEGDRKPSCLSCHSMHRSEPNDQLAYGKEDDGACLSCHAKLRDDIGAHTHHAPSSEGSRCLSCHMPKTTFALLGAIRSHRVEVPRADLADRQGADRLPACNLCHVDRTVGWTEGLLARWYGKRSVARSPEQSAIRWLLAGDAAKRALAAAHLGEPAARAATPVGWQPPLLAHLLDDPYAAVRFVAARSLRTFAGFEDFAFDFVGDGAKRRDGRARALKQWAERGDGKAVPTERRREVLLSADGTLNAAAFDELASQRDNRAITIAE